MAASKPKLTSYVDVVSPFAYMAYYITRHSPAFTDCDITYTPIFLGGVMKATNNRPPLQIKNKDKWIVRERRRWCRQFDIPIADRVPDGFPINTVKIQRALIAVAEAETAPTKLPEVLDACFHAFWVERNEGKGAGEGLVGVLGKVLGAEEAGRVVEHSTSDEVKSGLSARTEEAVKAGAFGLPYFVATNTKGETDSYWGFDHLGQVLDHLGLDRAKLGGRSQTML